MDYYGARVVLNTAYFDIICFQAIYVGLFRTLLGSFSQQGGQRGQLPPCFEVEFKYGFMLYIPQSSINVTYKIMSVR